MGTWWECSSWKCVWRVLFWCGWKMTLCPTSVANISQGSSLFARFFPAGACTSHLCKEQRDMSYTEPFRCATCFSKNTTAISLLWQSDEKKAVELLIFFNPCLSNLTSCFVHHHTFTLLPRPPKSSPLLISEEPGAWGGGIKIPLWSQAIKEETCRIGMMGLRLGEEEDQ